MPIRSISLLKRHEPWGVVFKLTILSVLSWRRRDSVPANQGYREAWGLSQIKTCFGWMKTGTLAHYQPSNCQGCSDWCSHAHSVRYEESQTSFAKCPKHESRCPHPQQIQDIYDPGVLSAAGNLHLPRALMWMWLIIFWSLSQIWDNIDHIMREVVSRSLWKANNWKIGEGSP